MTEKQILEYWFTESCKQDNEILENVIKRIYWRMTEKFGKRFAISYAGTHDMIDSFFNKSNRKGSGCSFEKITEILRENNPITVLDDGLLNVIYFYPDEIIVLNIEHNVNMVKVYTHNRAIAEKWQERIPWEMQYVRSGNTYRYAVATGFKINSKPLNFQKFETDLEKNYNEDLPTEKILKFLRDDDPGLVLLHGEPGTGKTSYIKHLIGTELEKNFIIVPKELFNLAGQEAFIDFFMMQQDAVFVLEDCEKILMKREKGASLETILNMSDGILGSSFKTKFICTFNTDLGNIDKAILRKGRLKVRYEFKKLSLEKTRLHLPEAMEPMTLAEIYNPEDNGGKGEERKKVGF